ncbi:unnamed protein product [Ambrosiozyma monospora]|uniref:Unnamed protein product n=1 Tax=Ambrosiozyma monospora TaxID=43982 RepID=A0A9W7DDS0_AMBMO|nr:unnamed protein product [Ambrosiozyma monospora]
MGKGFQKWPFHHLQKNAPRVEFELVELQTPGSEYDLGILILDNLIIFELNGDQYQFHLPSAQASEKRGFTNMIRQDLIQNLKTKSDKAKMFTLLDIVIRVYM